MIRLKQKTDLSGGVESRHAGRGTGGDNSHEPADSVRSVVDKAHSGNSAPPAQKPLVKVSSRSGTAPPVEHQWKPGQSGNPSGRPKIIQSAYQARLMEPVMVEENVVVDGKIKKMKRLGTRAEELALTLVREGAKKFRLGCANAQLGAIQELRKVTEPTEEEERGNIDRDLTKLVVATLLSRQLPEKKASAIEV